MKRIVCFLLLATLFFINISYTNALTLSRNENVNLTISQNGNASASGITTYKYIYKFKKDEKNYTGNAYCLDPNVLGAGSANGYTIKRIVGVDPASKDYDAGLKKILINGDGVNDSDYLNTSFAIRSLTTMYKYGNGGNNDPSWASKYVNLAIDYMSSKYSDIQTLEITNISDCPSSSFISTSRGDTTAAAKSCYRYVYQNSNVYSWYKDYMSSTFGNISIGKSLFEDGLAASVASHKNAATETTTGEASVTYLKDIIDEGNGKRVIYTFTFKDYPTDGSKYIKNMTLNATSDSFDIGALQYHDGTEWKSLPSDGSNLYDLVASQTGTTKTLKIGFLATPKEGVECVPLNYTISYDELGDSDEYIAVIAEQAGHQRFVFLVKNEDGGGGTEENKTIEDVLECGDQPAECATTISTPACDKTNNKAEVVAPTNIKGCIIDKKDDVGNSYTASESTYCSIFCKEDYAKIELTGPLNDGSDDGVKCLGYFQLNGHIDGSKDCYETFDVEAYKIKIEEEQNAMIDKLNNYNEAKAKYDIIDSMRRTEEYYCAYDSEGAIIGCDIAYSYTGYNGGQYSWTKYALSATSDGNYNVVSGGTGSSRVSSYYDDCSCTGVSGCETIDDVIYGTYINNTQLPGICSDNAEDDYNSALSSARSAMNNAKSAVNGANGIKDVVDAYNTCASTFKDNATLNDFKFEQEIKWDYAEGRNNNGTVDWENPYTSGIINAEDQKLTMKGDASGRMESYYCTGDVTDDAYNECSTGWTGTLPSAVNKKYIVCSLVGDTPKCEQKDFSVSPVKNAKIRYEKSADYETPSVYYQSYPTAKISNEAAASSSNFQFVQLENKLPTSSKLVGGGWYTLTITKLGEYYDATDTGRLLGGSGGKPSIGGNVSATWGGEYTCNFSSPCQPSDCPACKFVCAPASPKSCIFEDVDCPECKIRCSTNGCLINFGAVSASTKTISTTALAQQTGCTSCTSNVDGSESEFRKFGYNWNINTSIEKFELVTAKAKATIEAIDEKNTTIYDDSAAESGTASSSTDLVFRITLTPSMAKDIKQYNNDEIENGGYGNDTLKCEDYTSEGITYKNIFCYSVVVDKWVDQYGDKIYAPNRGNNDLYFTPWAGAYKEDAHNDAKLGGPSWK